MKTYIHKNLALLWEAQHGMTTDQAARFQNAFLGALSADVDPNLWAEVLKFTQREFSIHEGIRDWREKAQEALKKKNEGSV
jgi:hypothetical protein